MTRRHSTARAQGYAHQRARAAALAALRDGAPCWRCGLPMWRTAAHLLDLGHDDADPARYTGLEHRHCNRSAGATLGNRRRQRTAAPTPHSRVW